MSVFGSPFSLSKTLGGFLAGIALPDALSIAVTPLTVAYEGVAYAGFDADAFGGTPPYVFDVSGMPPGLDIDPVSGVSIGTPISGSRGTYTVAINVTDAAGAVVYAVPFTLIVTLQAPTFSVQPTLTYTTAQEGVTVTCNPGTAGPFVGTPTYQWVRGSTDITGSISKTRSFTSADVGLTIKCRVTYANATNSVSASTASTPIVAAAAATAPTNTVAPVIEGSTLAGNTLARTSVGTWSGVLTGYADQWQKDGVDIAGETATTYVTKQSDAGHTIRDAVRALYGSGSKSAATFSNGITIGTGTPLQILTKGTTTTTGGGTGVPIGLGGKRAYAGSVYSETSDIPAGALKRSNYNSLHELVAAMRAANPRKAGIIDGKFTVGPDDLCLANGELYGLTVGGVKPELVFSGSQNKCLMYCFDGNIKVRGITFTSFSTVFGFATASVRPTGGLGDGSLVFPYHSTSTGYFDNFVAAGSPVNGSVAADGTETNVTKRGAGLGVDSGTYAVGTIGAVGPTFDIRDCTFLNCASAAGGVSDGMTMAPVNFHRNKLNGTMGGCVLVLSVVPDFYASDNEHYDCYGSRVQSGKSYWVQNTFMLGMTYGNPHKNIRRQNIYIQNNYVHNVHSATASDGLNAATMLAIYNCGPATVSGSIHASGTDWGNALTWTCSITVSHNLTDDLNAIPTAGTEDAQAIYGKVLGIVLEYNRLIKPGGADARLLDPTKSISFDGPECGGILFKEPGDYVGAPTNSAFVMRYNEIIDPYGHTIQSDSSNRIGVPNHMVIKTDNCGIPLYIGWNIISGWVNTAIDTIAAIRPIGNMPKGCMIENNSFDNCLVTGGTNALIAVIQGGPASGTGSAIRNNLAFPGSNATYSQGINLIRTSGSISVSNNFLVNPSANEKYSMAGTSGSLGTAPPHIVFPAGGSSTVTTPDVLENVMADGVQVYV